MRARTRPARKTTTVSAATGLLILFISGCYHPAPPYEPVSTVPEAKPAKTARPKPEPAKPAQEKAATAQTAGENGHDVEIDEIMTMARDNQWAAAAEKSEALYKVAPQDPVVQRVHTWVTQSVQQRREQAVEDQIRAIDAKSSPFSPTLKSLVTDSKDRGLPARKDVRDAISKIESAPYIPETFNKVITERGPLFDMESTKGRMSKVLDKEVTIHLDNVPLETIIVNLSQSAGINIVADKSLAALKQILSVNLEKVKLSEFFRYISRNYDLQFQVGDELVWVVDAKDPKKLMEETRFYRLRKGFVLPAEFGSEDVNRAAVTVNNITTVTETTKYRKFVNDQAPLVPSLEKAIKELWTGTKFLIDYERNLVVARGTEEQLQVMERIIEEFDRPIQQVLIEARFVTISKPAFMQLGVLWETGRPTGTNSAFRRPRDFTGLVNSDNIPGLGIGIQETFTNVLDSATLTATISALEQTGESQTLSAPRLTVLNNRPANINDGKVQYYYEEYTVKSTVQQYYTTSSFVPSGKPTKITSGAELNVLASISGDGNSILLALNPRVNTDVQLVRYATLTDYNSEGNVQNTFDINLPQYRTQELSTRVTVKSGETVVMGGVIERNKSILVESVPVLGDLPLVGALFRRRTEQDIPRYLLIFVTATIVKDTGELLVYRDHPELSTNAPAVLK